jgi:predicted dehydrogenase
MLNAGYIGLGRMGITHFSILNGHPHVKNAAVCDQSQTMLKILNKYTGVSVFQDYHKMIQEADLDFVVISTPSASHAAIIKDAVDNDLHTFSEKPLAMSPAEGNDVLKHVAGKNLVHQVGYVNRFNEVFMEVKNLLEAGVIGEIKHFSSEMYGATLVKDAKSNWRGTKKTGGGCMYEFASHCIDLALYLFGRPDQVKGSVLLSIYSSEVEDLVESTFVYDRGCVGSISVNWSDESFRKPKNIIKIFGKEGRIVADKHAYKIFLKKEDEARGFHKGWNTRYITDFAQPVRFYVRGNEFTRQLDYFVDGILQKRGENISSFNEAYNTDFVMDQITKDAAGLEIGSSESNRQKSKSSDLSGKNVGLWKKMFKS